MVAGATAGRNVRASLPLVRHIEGKVWELREESQGNIFRLLYFLAPGRRIVLLHGFAKKTQRLPRRELEIALRRLARFEEREGVNEPVKETYTQKDGRRHWEEERARRKADPEYRAIYEKEGAKKALWLQLVEARMASGLTQAEVARRLGISQSQVARIEKRGYDAYTLRSLRRYVEALGDGFSLEVNVRSLAREQGQEAATA
jgi:DNA-binding XRE family transcriptional regulator